VVAKEFEFTHLEFYCTYRRTGDEDYVETSSNPRNIELQKNISLDADQICLKELDLGNPGITLIRVDRERAVCCNLSQNGPTIGSEKRRDIGRVICVQGGEGRHTAGSERARYEQFFCSRIDEMSLREAGQGGFHRGSESN
jgi:hypothetical protein